MIISIMRKRKTEDSPLAAMSAGIFVSVARRPPSALPPVQSGVRIGEAKENDWPSAGQMGDEVTPIRLKRSFLT